MPASKAEYGRLLADLEAEQGALDERVAPLGDADMDLATPAEGWAIRDQLSHLAFFDDVAALAVSNPPKFAKLAESAAAGTDPMDEHLRRGRAMRADELVTWWRTARAELLAVLGALEPEDRIAWFGPPMGALSFVSARLMETWAHGVDVLDALRVPVVPTSRLRHVAHLGVRARPYSYAVRGLALPEVTVAVELEAPSGEKWVWDAGNAMVSTVRGEALDFCLVVVQRRNVADTGLVVEGDAAEQWMQIAQAFAGPPGPGRPPSATASTGA